MFKILLFCCLFFSHLVLGLDQFTYKKSFKNKYIGVASFEVETPEQASQKLYFSIFNHNTYLRYQILSEDTQNVFYLSKVKILFETARDKKEFKAKLYNRTAHPSELWILEEQNTFLIIKNALVVKDDTTNPFKASSKNDLRFLVADALVHVPELINSMSDKWLMPVKNDVFLSSPLAAIAKNINQHELIEEIKRIVKIDKLKLRKMITQSGYPADLQELIYDKILARINQAIELLHLEQSKNTEDWTKINNTSVKNGILVNSYFDNEVTNYIESKNKTNNWDMIRYYVLEGVSLGLNEGLNQVEKLINPNLSFNIAQVGQSGGAFPQFFFVQPNIGYNFHVGRDVTHFSPIDTSLKSWYVADSNSVEYNIGATLGLREGGAILPSIGAGVRFRSTISHYRKVEMFKEAASQKWQNLFVPVYYSKIVKAINCQDSTNHCYEQLLKAMPVGDILSMSTEMITGGRAGVTIPIITPATPLITGTVKVNIYGGIERLMLNQVVIERTPEGIRVYLYDKKWREGYGGVSLEYFLTFIKLQFSKASGTIETKIFDLPRIGDSVTLFESAGKSLQHLVADQDRHPIEESFMSREIKNEMSLTRTAFEFLFFFKREIINYKNIITTKDEEKKVERKFLIFKSGKSKSVGLPNPISWGEDILKGTDYKDNLSLDKLEQSSNNIKVGKFLGNTKSFYITTIAEYIDDKVVNPVIKIEWTKYKRKKNNKLDTRDYDFANEIAQKINRNKNNQLAFAPPPKIPSYLETRYRLVLSEASTKKFMSLLNQMNEMTLINKAIKWYGIEEYKAFCSQTMAIFSNQGPHVLAIGEQDICLPVSIQKLLNLIRKNKEHDDIENTHKIFKLLLEDFGFLDVLNDIEICDCFFDAELMGYDTNGLSYDMYHDLYEINQSKVDNLYLSL